MLDGDSGVPSFAIGTELGRYRIAGFLGHGGMGAVYEAIQTDLGRRVALKVLHGKFDDGAFARFRREALAAASLNHPNVVQVTDFQPAGEATMKHPDGQCEPAPAFLVMDLVTAPSLRTILIREGQLTPARAARIAVQMLAGLSAAHDAGILHRDIKPANVLVVDGGPTGELIKICDFGVAKLESDTDYRTTVGAVVGTIAYMPPEQITAQRVEARTDVYAVGVCLFEMLAGVRPFQAPTELDLASAICLTPPADLARLAPHVPPELRAIVERSLHKMPDGRFESARALSQALTPFLRETADVTSTADPAPPKAGATMGATITGSARSPEHRGGSGAPEPLSPPRDGSSRSVGIGASAPPPPAPRTPSGRPRRSAAGMFFTVAFATVSVGAAAFVVVWLVTRPRHGRIAAPVTTTHAPPADPAPKSAPPVTEPSGPTEPTEEDQDPATEAPATRRGRGPSPTPTVRPVAATAAQPLTLTCQSMVEREGPRHTVSQDLAPVPCPPAINALEPRFRACYPSAIARGQLDRVRCGRDADEPRHCSAATTAGRPLGPATAACLQSVLATAPEPPGLKTWNVMVFLHAP